MDQSKVKDFINFHIQRKITILFTSFLNQIEDLKADGLNIPEVRYQRLRKRVLDSGNDCMRDLESTLDKFDISFKQDLC